ncbi:lasso peptide biosynthesis PqqD family chaperone [Paenibacillus arenilitoris]|uniref:Lasso peptide biosynthesis PqqD family chaperone n=1 Tax=Paenibacillus arenilitoris TaxID=2772299 RepID=A0A927CUM1_9BACL|nr:lasso peptide biosynthesis PqqD family chaperone [Paenibacillus arenilitoris]MBD2872156.1 lasso peptide biosynthesis PqqD family chaperone [Paenibacillus arenilitoris]
MSVDMIALSGLVVQSQGYLVSEMNGEKVMLSIENGKYYNLGQIGGRVWELIESPASIQDVVDRLVTEYVIEPEECQRQVRRFLQQLKAEGLIQVGKE